MRVVLKAVILLAVLALPVVARNQFDMGPARQFTPVAGDEANFIQFSNGYVIDTRVGEPPLPAELKLEGPEAAGQYYIVQFSGPIEQAWVSRLHEQGIGVFGYLPHYAMLARLDPAQLELVSAQPFVRWVGVFQPAYKLEPGLLDEAGMRRVVILAMRGEDLSAITDQVEALGGVVEQTMTSSFGTTITAALDESGIAAVARLSETFWVQAFSEGSFCNNTSQWVMQSGYMASSPPDTSMAARPAWRNGVRGQGVIMSATDTGLNTGHDMFRDPSLSITPPGVWPGHRKVVAYKRFGTADVSEGQYHGSHVAGSICGNDSITGGTSYYDGMAKDARYYFVDITNGTSFLVPTDHTPMWDTVYAGRGLPDSLRPIKQESGSWGWPNSQGTYLIQDASTDAFSWAHKDFMNLMAAGNESSTRRLRNPGIAKNVLTIGATNRGTGSNSIASFSSRGPTQDNRIKPNVVAPGVDIWSANRTGTNTYAEMSGTSMATPTANGTVGLMRCYLQEGYYPTGTPEPGNRISYVSAALLRSMAMASADPNVGSYTIPSFDIGWGRIDADSVLYFAGDARKLIIMDDTMGLATGEFKELRFRVNSSIPLRVCLAWTDTAAAPNSNPTLVNDLNLELIAPGGTEFRGNKYASGQSQPNPGTWDAVNVEECARINAPDTGVWTIWIGAQNVATGSRQPFAWTLTGDVAPVLVAHDVGAVRIVEPGRQVDSGTVVAPKALVRNYGTSDETFDVIFSIGRVYADTQAVRLLVGATDTVTFADWVAQPVGWHGARVQTTLVGDENPANDVATDSFQVIPTTGIEGGTSLPRRFSISRLGANPSVSTGGVRYELPRSVDVRVTVYSADGRQVKTLLAGAQRPGYYALPWNGTNDAGRTVGTGIYYVQMQAGEFSGTVKLVKSN